MKLFFSTLFRWLGRLRSFLVNGLFIALVAIYLVLIFGGQAEVPEHAALIIDPSGQMVEELKLPTSALPLGLNITAPNQTNLHDLVEAIQHAATDER
ncbi:MAG: signal peptide peptidase SppA, partial [Mariprofundus sp.]|nr:signal peptide peptidase SppA [Mariprofundus sp.]